MESVYNYIDIDKRKGFIGALIGLVLLVICCTWYNFFVGLFLAALYTVSGFIKIKVHSRKSCISANIIGSFCVIVATWLGSMAMLGVVARMGISLRRLILNFVIILIVCLVIMTFTANWRSALIVGTFLLMLLCIANGFIFQFRGKELAPLDFLSLKTAASVAEKYVPKLTLSMLCGIAGWLWTVFMLFAIPKFPNIVKISPIKVRLACLAADLVLVLLLFLSTGGIKIKLWDSQGTRINGYFLNFFLELRDSTVDKPNNYSPNRVKEIFEKHTEPVSDTNTAPEKTETVIENNEVKIEKPQMTVESNVVRNDEDAKPNIIVIMNESFADFRVLGDNLRTNIPVTPFIDSLTENTVKGYAMSSVYGGNTANSEFEFLTGHSMAFLPDNSVPYQQYINDEIYSLPWVLRSNGYKCISTHPYLESGWSREHIYPRLGFVESTFIDDYTDPEIIREYVSDRETFEFVIDSLKRDESDKPMFIFGITMQNHGGYSYKEEDFIPTVSLEGYRNEYPTVEQYLTLANITDSAVEYLITELDKFSEDTIVMFFGDHFPGLNHNFFEEVHGGDLKTLEERMLLYKVPFFMWANFDIDEKEDVNTSLNYLSVDLLRTADITFPPFYEFLDKCRSALPALNLYGFYSNSSEAFVSYSDATPVEMDWLEEYSVLQYNNLIDSKNRDYNFKYYTDFGEVLPENEREAEINIE